MYEEYTLEHDVARGWEAPPVVSVPGRRQYEELRTTSIASGDAPATCSI